MANSNKCNNIINFNVINEPRCVLQVLEIVQIIEEMKSVWYAVRFLSQNGFAFYRPRVLL